AILDTGPIARIDASDERACADLLAKLEPADAERLAAALGRLRQEDDGFSLAIAGAEGGAWTAEGRKAASGDAVVWLADAASTRQAEAAQRAASVAAEVLREFFDALPLPVWRRDQNIKLIDCNLAYATALDTGKEPALAEGRELAPISGRSRAVAMARTAAEGTMQSERRHLVIGGSRRLLEV